MTFNFITPIQKKVVASLSIPLFRSSFLLFLCVRFVKITLKNKTVNNKYTLTNQKQNHFHHFIHTIFFKSLIKIFADSFMSAKLLQANIIFLSCIRCSLFHLCSNLAHPWICNNKNIVWTLDFLFIFKHIFYVIFHQFFLVQFQLIDF